MMCKICPSVWIFEGTNQNTEATLIPKLIHGEDKNIRKYFILEELEFSFISLITAHSVMTILQIPDGSHTPYNSLSFLPLLFALWKLYKPKPPTFPIICSLLCQRILTPKMILECFSLSRSCKRSKQERKTSVQSWRSWQSSRTLAGERSFSGCRNVLILCSFSPFCLEAGSVQNA